MAYIVNRITLGQIKAAKSEVIYYSAQTCWWTHDSAHLCLNSARLPSDPRGGVLFEAHDVDAWFQAAEAKPDHYGKHGLAAFIAAHHLNCVVSLGDWRSTCMETWREYNALIDAAGADGV